MTRKQRWFVLFIVLMATFMAILDVAIVNVAIPSIRANLHASYGEIELVVSAYTLTYASLLVTGGRLGDNYGRKLLIIVGLIVFAVASAGCGRAPSSYMLIGALLTSVWSQSAAYSASMQLVALSTRALLEASAQAAWSAGLGWR
jgi:MFS family permease